MVEAATNPAFKPPMALLTILNYNGGNHCTEHAANFARTSRALRAIPCKRANDPANYRPGLFANFARTSREFIQYLCFIVVPNTWGVRMCCTNFLLCGGCQWG